MRKTARGFTLVELAIVMTIIGLLIGGILKGQEILENARITATIAQMRDIRTALVSFQDIYAAMPGDMSDASTRIPGCTVACDMDPANVSTGGNLGRPDDGFIGATNWSGQWHSQICTPLTNAAQSGPLCEQEMFWIILAKAGLITGVSDVALRVSTPQAFGVTHPTARIGGGFVVGQGNAARLAGQTAGNGPKGLILAIASVLEAPGSPPISGAGLTTAGINVMTPAQAAQIDRKIDDGMANTGDVQAFGTAGAGAGTGCFTTTGGLATYSESNNSRDCGIATSLKE